MLVSWLAATALAAAMAIAAVFPTYFWLRAARIPPLVAGVLAPAVTLAVLVLLGAAYASAGIFWSGARVLPVLGVLGVIGGAVFAATKRPGSFRPTLPWGPIFLGAIALGWVVAVLPAMMAAPPDYPVQQWDPSFHMNGVWSINHEGNARYGEGLAANFVSRSDSGYPLGWHIFVALFSVPRTVVFAANASSLAITLLWVIGTAAYTRTLFPAHAVWALAPILAGGLLGMPADALAAYSQWPNATGVALLPGLASFAILLGRKVSALWTLADRDVSLPGLAVWVGVLASALLGAVVAHPSVAFNLVALLAAAAAAGSYALVRADVRNRRWWAIPILGAAVAASLYVLWRVFQSDAVRNMGEYPRAGISVRVALQNFFAPSPPYPDSLSLFMWVATISVLLLAGVAAIALSRRATFRFGPAKRMRLPVWPVWSYLTFSGLVFLAYGPDSAFREFVVAPWFLDARRIMEPQGLAAVPLAALGLVALGRAAGALFERNGRVLSTPAAVAGVVGALLLVSLGEGFTARLDAAQSVLDPTRLGKPGMATAGELKMLRGLDASLPKDAKILGDPQNGSVYVQMIGQRPTYFPTLTLSRHPDEHEAVLRESFRDIHLDPRVCEALAATGITHFYADADGYYYSRLRSDRTPGLYDVDTSSGFELVAEGDSARLYRITACDDPPPHLPDNGS